MNGTAFISAVRAAILDEDLPISGVHVAGSLDATPALPYVLLSLLPSSEQRVATDAAQGLDGVQIDVVAKTLAAAIGLADAIDEVVLALGSVSLTSGATATGIERAAGGWRTVFPPDAVTPAERSQRVASLYQQTEIRTV